MRFMMLMIPKGYEKTAPNTTPPAAAVEKMMKYNAELQKAGVLLSLDGLHPLSSVRGLALPTVSQSSPTALTSRPRKSSGVTG